MEESRAQGSARCYCSCALRESSAGELRGLISTTIITADLCAIPPALWGRSRPSTRGGNGLPWAPVRGVMDPWEPAGSRAAAPFRAKARAASQSADPVVHLQGWKDLGAADSPQ